MGSSDSKCQEWGAQMMRHASWQASEARKGESKQLHDAVAATVETDGPSPLTEPSGLSQADRAKSGSREINIDEAVFEAARKDALQRASTLPNPMVRVPLPVCLLPLASFCTSVIVRLFASLCLQCPLSYTFCCHLKTHQPISPLGIYPRVSG